MIILNIPFGIQEKYVKLYKKFRERPFTFFEMLIVLNVSSEVGSYTLLKLKKFLLLKEEGMNIKDKKLYCLKKNQDILDYGTI